MLTFLIQELSIDQVLVEPLEKIGSQDCFLGNMSSFNRHIFSSNLISLSCIPSLHSHQSEINNCLSVQKGISEILSDLESI